MTQLVISGRIAQQTGEIPVALIMRRERHHVPAAGIQLDHGAVRKVDRPGITGVLRSAQDDRVAVQKQIVVEFPFLLVGEELKQSVYEYETTCGEECTLEHYLAHVALFTNADAGDSRDRVKLMTVHTAKGLEFPHVFLCAMNEGLFPSKKIRTLPAMEEERRLAFVAMTRAEQGLYLSEAAGRNFDGTDRYPSRFLLDIDPGLLEQSGERDDMLLDNARSYIAISERTLRGSADAAAFRPGQRVRHSILGTGTMLELDEAKQAWLIRFDGLPTPRRISFRARLTPCPEQEGDTPS